MSIGNYVAQRAELVLTAGESEALTAELEAVKSQHTGVMRFSKSLNQRLSVALKTVYEAVAQRFTSILL